MAITKKRFLPRFGAVTTVTANPFPNQSEAVPGGVPMSDHMRGMSNEHRKKNFTPSDDALILQQPATGICIKTLATMLGTSREMLIRRAGELGVSLAISDDHDDAFDTRAIRCSDGLVDPLLDRLKLVHGDRK